MKNFTGFKDIEICFDDFKTNSFRTVPEIQESWSPLISFKENANASIDACNPLFLLQMLENENDDTIPFTSILNAPYHRKLVCFQSGYFSSDFDLTNAQTDASDFQKINTIKKYYSKWDQLTKSKKLQFFSLLMQLSFHQEALNLIKDTNLQNQQKLDLHLYYETARCIHRIHPQTDLANQILFQLLNTSNNWIIQFSSVIQLISLNCRTANDLSTAFRFISKGQQLLSGQKSSLKSWQHHLLLSRYHRVVALYFVLMKNIEQVFFHMELAFQNSEKINQLSAEKPELIQQYADENLKICLESMVKLHANLKSKDGLQYVERLVAHENNSPHAYLCIGDFFEAIGQSEQAANALHKSALGGGGRAAGSAFRAAMLYQDNSQSNQAEQCLELACSLNPTAGKICHDEFNLSN